MLDEAASHAREDAGRTDDPRAKALFETTAEASNGLAHAYRRCLERSSESAWQ